MATAAAEDPGGEAGARGGGGGRCWEREGSEAGGVWRLQGGERREEREEASERESVEAGDDHSL